jgi:protein TonB
VIAVESAPRAAEPGPVVPAVAPQPASPPQAASRLEPQAAPGPDPGSVARFRLELMEIARRYKRYPRIAQDNNWEGRVELRVVFAENGAMSALTVKKSAGRAVLDEEAQAMIRSAQAQAAVPAALRGKAFTLEIPVEFSLQDAR